MQIEYFDVLNKLKLSGLIKLGLFTLKSGKKSNVYFDFKGLNGHPELVRRLSVMLSELINTDNPANNNYCLAGVPLGAISYSTHVAHILNKPMVLIREEKKTYGLESQIEGNTNGMYLVLIEDVITTGKSVIDTLHILKNNNIYVNSIVCILDREEGGVQNIENLGYKVKCLYKLSDLYTASL